MSFDRESGDMSGQSELLEREHGNYYRKLPDVKGEIMLYYKIKSNYRDHALFRIPVR